MIYQYPSSMSWPDHLVEYDGCARQSIDNCTAAELFEALKSFDFNPKDQFLTRYIFDIFLKNETQLGIRHVLYPKYKYRAFLSEK